MLIVLIYCSIAWATTYYLDSSVADDSQDGTTWQKAKKTWSGMNTLLDALGDDGAGDTVDVNDGSYGELSTGVLSKARTDWLTIQAASGASPLIENIYIYCPSHTDVYLVFDGIDVGNGSGSNTNYSVSIQDVNWFTIKNCDIILDPVAAPADAGGIYAPYYAKNSDTFKSRDSFNILIENCEIVGGDKGVVLDGNDLTVSGCTIHDQCSDAIAVGSADRNTKNVTLEENLVYMPIPLSGTHEPYGTTKVGNFTPGELVSFQGTSTLTGMVAMDGAEPLCLYCIDGPIKPDYDAAKITGVTGLQSGATLTDLYKCDQSHCDLMQRDSAGNSLDNFIIRRNYFNDLPGENEGAHNASLKLYNKTITNVTIESNYVSGRTPAFIQGPTGLIINNNTFVGDNGHGFLIRPSQADYNPVIDEMYNNVFELFRTITGPGTITIVAHGNNIYKTIDDQENCLTLGPTDIYLNDSQEAFDALFAGQGDIGALQYDPSGGGGGGHVIGGGVVR